MSDSSIKWLKRALAVFFILLSAFMIITVIRASTYTVLSGDDFSHGNDVGEFHTGFWSYLLASFRFAGQRYMTWQGTYFSMFLQALLSPINQYGLMQLRCVMFANSLLFYGSLLYFLTIFMKRNEVKDPLVKCVFIAAVIFAVCGYDAYNQVFLWFSGSTSYGFPLSVLLVAFSYYIQTDLSDKKAYLISAVLLGFLAMGGTLMIAGLGCYAALLILAHRFLRDRRICPKDLLVFLTWLSGAVINTAAPGNYVRHSWIDDGMHPLRSLKYAFTLTDRRWQFLTSENFAFLLVAVFACSLYISSNKKKDILKAAFSVLGLFAPVVAVFPMALGYSIDKLPNRCAFIIDIAIIFSSFYCAFTMGEFCKALLDKNSVKAVLVNAALLGVICVLLDGYGLSDFKTMHMAAQLHQGVYQDHFNVCRDFLEMLSEYPKGSDVRVSEDEVPYEIDNCRNFCLFPEDDSDYWINKEVAKYFGLNSLVIYSEEQSAETGN